MGISPKHDERGQTLLFDKGFSGLEAVPRLGEDNQPLPRTSSSSNSRECGLNKDEHGLKYVDCARAPRPASPVVRAVVTLRRKRLASLGDCVFFVFA
jgi:hypothetical protein